MEHTLELLSECAPLLILAGAAVGWRAAIARWTLGVQGALMITMCAMCALKKNLRDIIQLEDGKGSVTRRGEQYEYHQILYSGISRPSE